MSRKTRNRASRPWKQSTFDQYLKIAERHIINRERGNHSRVSSTVRLLGLLIKLDLT